MARKQIDEQPAVRKSLLYVAGAAVGAALIGFVLMNFVLGGGGGSESTDTPAAPVAPQTGTAPTTTPTPAPVKSEISPGGRDPFAAQAVAAPAQQPAPAAASAPTQTTTTISNPAPTTLASSNVQHYVVTVLKVYGNAADVKVDDQSFEGVKANDKLPDGLLVKTVANGCVTFSQGGKTFNVCQGQSVKQ